MDSQESQGIIEKPTIVMKTILNADESFHQMTIRNLSENVTALGTLLSNLRIDLGAQTVISTELESKLEGLLSAVSYLESGSGPLATTDDVTMFKSGITDSMNNIFRLITDMESKIHSKISNHMKEIEIKNSTLDNIVTSRQSHMLTQMSNLAKEVDLKAIEDRFNYDIQSHSARIQALQVCAKINEQLILEFKQRMSLSTFVRIASLRQRSLYRKAISMWTRHLESVDKIRLRCNTRKFMMRKIVIRCWYSKKVAALKKWRDYANWLKSIENRHEQALRILLKIIRNHMCGPLRDSFHIWRRRVIASASFDQSHHSDQAPTNPYIHDTAKYSKHSTEISTSVHFCTLLQSFKDDKDGAIEVLANEIMNIRNIEFPKIIRDISETQAQIMAEVDASLKREMSDIKCMFLDFKDRILTRIDALYSDVMYTKSRADEAQNLIEFSMNKNDIIERTLHDRIQALLAINASIETESRKTKDELKECQQKISQIEFKEKNNQDMLRKLSEKISQIDSFKQEIHHDFIESSEQNKEIISKLYTEMTSKELSHKKLLDDVSDLRNDVIQQKIKSNESFDELHKILHSYGISEPKFDEIIKYGALHENISKEKNYVIPINCIFEISSFDVDVPTIIAAFAHDYAEWIAYHSDQLSLKLTVVCRNANEAVDTEDETEERRQNLVARFKKKIYEELDNLHPGVGSNRLEARTFYISRVIDAIETALSKHNQVFIPGSTRLGRVRSTIATCVACDRPLSRKTTRRQADSQQSEEKETKIINRSKTIAVGDETQKYIMRSGFKFPLKKSI